MSVDAIVMLVILALATYRLGTLLAHDDGPADILLRIRERLEARGERRRIARLLADLMGCIRCNSMWIGWGLAYVWTVLFGYQWPWCLLTGPAFSAAAMLLYEFTRDDE